MVDELSIVASYYILFAAEGKQEQARWLDKHNSECEEWLGGEFWVEDQWTAEDYSRAGELLLENLEKCAISSLHGVKEGDDDHAWNQFYRDHKTSFFKDRHYLSKDYPEEFCVAGKTHPKTLVEIGCGVGNTILPLLDDRESPWRTIHALDISKEAIHLLFKDPRFMQCNADADDRSIEGHICDIAKEFPSPCVGVADVTTLLFCLSAIDPDAMGRACRNVASSLKPGGTVVFRDYGRYDEAQMKLGLSRQKLLKNNFYRKHDGTKCFYFSLEDLETLFRNVGLEILELRYIRRVYGNKSSGEKRRRVWVHGRFRKPIYENK